MPEIHIGDKRPRDEGSATINNLLGILSHPGTFIRSDSLYFCRKRTRPGPVFPKLQRLCNRWLTWMQYCFPYCSLDQFPHAQLHQRWNQDLHGLQEAAFVFYWASKLEAATDLCPSPIMDHTGI
jgi:hypothetical protein